MENVSSLYGRSQTFFHGRGFSRLKNFLIFGKCLIFNFYFLLPGCSLTAFVFQKYYKRNILYNFKNYFLEYAENVEMLGILISHYVMLLLSKGYGEIKTALF